jgi:hypothetical protein
VKTAEIQSPKKHCGNYGGAKYKAIHIKLYLTASSGLPLDQLAKQVKSVHVLLGQAMLTNMQLQPKQKNPNAYRRPSDQAHKAYSIGVLNPKMQYK